MFKMNFIQKNYVYIAVFTGNLIFFICGTAITWSSPMLAKLKDKDESPFGRAITKDEESWIGSLLTLGAIFGPVVFAFSADKIGRKFVIIILGLPFLLSFITLTFAKTVALYYCVRIFTGIAVGGAFTVLPMYIGEVAEDSNRGTLGASMNVFITFGLLFSYVVGPFVSIVTFHILLAIVPALFIVLFFLIAPDSPYYLVKKDGKDAEIALQKIRGSKNVTKEIEEIKVVVKESEGGSFVDIFRDRGQLKSLIIGMGLIFFQQFSGINVVLFYTQAIFKAAGSTIPDTVSPIIIGVVEVLSSFITTFTADRYGRKILIIISCIGMFLSEVPLGIYFYLSDNGHDVNSLSWLPLITLVLYIVFYNTAMGPIPWGMLGELFPSNTKSLAVSAVSSFCWMCGFFITKYFSSVEDAIGKGPSFWIFAGFSLMGAIFGHFYVIETKGKSLQEIQNELKA